ncbi:glycoside hydrolase family 71/99-like protein [Myxococcus qinghaiensis]|uniref:glycoside hydrolase family 71/99-like protein n=1 Tax=Myxococcus qinghaiensis TaxID=2906758 RepID=UPI0020A6DBE3|nr:glycoside hydrolase family 71/99-like protein [Myxococcus qinghaiensis]MCP3162199.1 glycoside hydrolase family 71/99-like protein [Myxococcus qinghaiensis]
MKRSQWLHLGVALVALVLAGCNDSQSGESQSSGIEQSSSGSALAPVRVPKSVGKKIYAHLMPWFETSSSSGNGAWGIHWTMANQNPNNVDGSGRRQIAAHYYPLIGPYASGDKDVIEYQLLLMKYAGVDGVLIDWPGTVNAWDYPKNKQNSEAFIARTAAVGLDFAIVYEDHNIQLAANAGIITDKLAAGRADMGYLRDHYFSQGNYIRVNNAPLLLDFGPQTFQTPSDWTNLFGALSPKPAFLTLWYESQEAGANASGEYAWIYSDFMAGLNHFYANRPLGLKMGVAYPGFHTFYSAGGWDGPTWGIPHNGLNSFQQTLDAALGSSVGHVQLATWNDYGEGTMLEPTREFGYGFLTTLQQRLGVPYSQRELELINTLYQQRKQHAGNAARQAELDQAFQHLVALQVAQAEAILNGGSTPTTIPLTNPSFESGMTGWSTWSPNGTGWAAFSETYNGAQTGAYHLTHWGTSAYETWTYQVVTGLPSGSYKASAWVRKGGDFGFAHLQVKTCVSCAPVFTSLGTHGSWTRVETPSISVTGGTLELGFHTQAPAQNGANFIHMDSVELRRQ